MPNCFALVDKKTNQRAVLQEVDRLMCENFKQPCDEIRYLCGWYNSVGLRLACGQSFTEILTEYQDYVEKANDPMEKDYYESMIEIIKWLDINYTSESWYEHK